MSRPFVRGLVKVLLNVRLVDSSLTVVENEYHLPDSDTTRTKLNLISRREERSLIPMVLAASVSARSKSFILEDQ